MPRHYSTNRLLCWHLTDNCNRHCEFCLSCSGPHIQHPSNDPFLIAARLNEAGVQKISYSGGEPFGFPGLERLVTAVDNIGMIQLITTNGDVLSRSIPGWISAFEYIKLSFVGGEALHNSLMGPGHYNQQLALARRLSDSYGMIVGVNFMLSPMSLRTLPEFLEDCSHACINNIMFQTFIFNRRPRVGQCYEFSLNPDRLEQIISMTSRYRGLFPGGIKIHDYATSSWFMVLTPDGQLKVPSSNLNPDFIMGSIFEDVLDTPDGRMPTNLALEYMWHKRAATSGIVVIDRGVTR